jgi:hypothetical protein
MGRRECHFAAGTAPALNPRPRTCPDAETLAAFIDGRLWGAARAVVVEHIADCAECRDVVLGADELRTAEGLVAAEGVVAERWWWRFWRAIRSRIRSFAGSRGKAAEQVARRCVRESK